MIYLFAEEDDNGFDLLTQYGVALEVRYFVTVRLITVGYS